MNIPQEVLPDNLILLGYRGSLAHGTYMPPSSPEGTDDRDIMGVFVAPLEHYMGFGRSDNKNKFVDEWDAVSYEIIKFVKLLLKCNPNVLNLLWLDESLYVFKHPVGQILIDKRNIFASKKSYYTFCGYAYSQLKKMTHHEYKGYMGQKRKKLVDKHGYDTRNASHLIRLLRMGIEFLNDGRLYVHRADAAELIAIKKGEWTLTQVQDEAESLLSLMEESYYKSPLPPEPDREKAERLVMEIITSYHFK